MKKSRKDDINNVKNPEVYAEKKRISELSNEE